LTTGRSPARPYRKYYDPAFLWLLSFHREKKVTEVLTVLFKTEDILKATGGVLVSSGPRSFARVSTDSRTIGKGDLFVPLVGARFDGHDYIPECFEKGASGALFKKGMQINAPEGRALIEVSDTLRALQDVAHYIRKKRADLIVVGVTGTNGKTTTKEMLSSVLSGRGPVLKNEGNLNNEIGLPLTLMGLKEEHWAAVLEMGMSGFGEIARLAEIAEPSVGIITNVGPAHIQTLGSLEGVAQAKGELISALPEGGKAVLNLDDPRLQRLVEENKGRAVTFGLRPGAAVTAHDINESSEGVSFRLITPSGSAAVKLPVMGVHNVYNALAAAAASWALGITVKEIKDGIERFSPVKMRMEVVDVAGVKVINDAYNANPASMAAALTAMASVRDGRRIAVLGDMLELGGASEKAHFDVGRLAGAEGLALLVLIGERAQDTARGAVEAGMAPEGIMVVSGHEEAADALLDKLRPGDHVLVKGSRGMKMEKVVELLRARRAVK
jgi:UDP-N-acetylmuramoyl-tripeptide--D-alanyl-D-alanine ligase